MDKKIISFILPVVLIILVFLIYIPVTQGHYFYGEDYAQTWTSIWEDEINAKSYLSILSIVPWEGRPLERLFTYFVFYRYINPLKSIEAANTVRLVGVIGIGLFSYVLFLLFKENRFRPSHAFLLSMLICTLPPLQTYVSRVYTVVFVYSVLLSALSALILFKTVFKKKMGKTYNACAVLCAMVLFVISLNIYQPAAITYWAFATVPLILIKDEDMTDALRASFIIYFVAGFASMIVYFGITKIIGFYLNSSIVDRGVFLYRFEIFDRILWFINYPLYGAVNLWNIFPTKEVGRFVVIVIISGAVISFVKAVFKIAAEKKRLYILSRYLIIILIIPLSYIVNIIVRDRLDAAVPPHRTLIGPEIVFLMLFYWGIMNIATFITYISNVPEGVKQKLTVLSLIILTSYTALLANHNIEKYFVKLHTDELRYVKNTIQDYGVSNLAEAQKIYIIKPEKKSHYEYGHLSSLGRGSSISMVKMALSDLGVSSDILIEYISYNNGLNEEMPEERNAVFIDMRKFQQQSLRSTEIVAF